MSDTDAPILYHVACEACRLKKCKCNKIIPVCGQCEKSGAQCVYPQTFKRGFPEGYLAAIEGRLLQTERALFEALSCLNGVNLDATSLSSIEDAFSAKQTKSGRMEEWDHFPLASAEERRLWYVEKASKMDLTLEKPTQRLEDTLMAQPTPSHDLLSFRENVVNVPTASWTRPYTRADDLSPRHETITAQFPHSMPGMSSVVPFTPDRHSYTSQRRKNTGEREELTPRDRSATTQADILSARQSRRFF